MRTGAPLAAACAAGLLPTTSSSCRPPAVPPACAAARGSHGAPASLQLVVLWPAMQWRSCTPLTSRSHAACVPCRPHRRSASPTATPFLVTWQPTLMGAPGPGESPCTRRVTPRAHGEHLRRGRAAQGRRCSCQHPGQHPRRPANVPACSTTCRSVQCDRRSGRIGDDCVACEVRHCADGGRGRPGGRDLHPAGCDRLPATGVLSLALEHVSRPDSSPALTPPRSHHVRAPPCVCRWRDASSVMVM